MLKLEKISQFSHFRVCLREKDRFFEGQLIIALAIALFLHLVALFLFEVKPFSFSSNFTFSPIQVDFDHSQQVSVFASPHFEKNEEILPSFSLIPNLERFFYPHDTLVPSDIPDPQAFYFLEEMNWPKWYDFVPSQLEESYVQLVISGDLAEIPLIATDSRLRERNLFFHAEPIYVTYQVQVDRKTGELFWYERTQSSESNEINLLTESILFNLYFNPSNMNEMINGTLNFLIFKNENISKKIHD